eukprot:8790547-Pyramimonas_sp.AAC.1
MNDSHSGRQKRVADWTVDETALDWIGLDWFYFDLLVSKVKMNAMDLRADEWVTAFCRGRRSVRVSKISVDNVERICSIARRSFGGESSRRKWRVTSQ